MNNTELKPCPFCGGEAIKSAFSWGNIHDEYTIQCTVCGARTTVLKSEEATERWNTRKPMDNIVAELEKGLENLEYNKKLFENNQAERGVLMCVSEITAFKIAIDIAKRGGVG